MRQPQSTFERRRLAVAHWRARAQNARFSAFMLSKLCDEPFSKETLDQCSYYGTPSIALHEAYLREAAVALELIVKAVIAHQLTEANADPLTKAFPTTHDLPRLWDAAGLPQLSREDRQRLIIFKSILMWAGRYPTAKTPEAMRREREEFDALETPPLPGTLPIRPALGLGWDRFDALYQLAAAKAHRLVSR